MNQQDEERLLTLLQRWSAFQVPGSFVDDKEEMQREIERLGPQSAPALARFLARKTHEKLPLLGILSTFCLEYLDTFPEAMTQALVEQLDAADPHVIVGLSIDVLAPDLSRTLIEKVRLDFDNVALVESFIFALRRQGDETARRFLAQMPREKMKPESIATLNEHLAWLESHPDYRRGR